VRQPKTPQEKKALSYKKDRHTFAWHSDKGLRKARPKRKASANQRYRRKADVRLQGLLKTAEPGNEDACVTNELLSSGLTRKRLSKILSCTLPEAIEVKQHRRQVREGRKVRVHQRQIEEAKSVASFLSKFNKQKALTLIDAIKLQRSEFAAFWKLRDSSPELFNTTQLLFSSGWSPGHFEALRLLGFDPDRLNKLIKYINRIAAERERPKQPRSAAARNRKARS
jgi:hypothetical protein